MGQLKPKNYLNGLFVDKKVGNYGEFFNINIPDIELFISNLRAMPTTPNGEKQSVRFVMEEQKTPGKMSIYLNTWKPTNAANSAVNTGSNLSTPATNSMVTDSSLDLPF